MTGSADADQAATRAEHKAHEESHWRLEAERLDATLRAVRFELGRIVSGGLGSTLPALRSEVARIRSLIPGVES